MVSLLQNRASNEIDRIFLFRTIAQAAKEGGSDHDSGCFDVHGLDGFMKLVVELGAFEHIRWGDLNCDTIVPCRESAMGLGERKAGNSTKFRSCNAVSHVIRFRIYA